MQLRVVEFLACAVRFARGLLRHPAKRERTVFCHPIYIVPIAIPPSYVLASTASRPPGDVAQCCDHRRNFLTGDAAYGLSPFVLRGTSTGWEACRSPCARLQLG